MVLNLVGLVDNRTTLACRKRATDKPTYASMMESKGKFSCHGQEFTSLTYREYESGYQDSMSKSNPTCDKLAYRQGYLDYLTMGGK